MPRARAIAGPASRTVTKTLLELVSRRPASTERLAADPRKRSRALARTAALKAATLSGSLALPPGPLGLATVLPDLIGIWRLQQAMVADIAAAFGQSAALRQETMLYCLFKHGGAALMRDVVIRAGERYLVRPVAVRALQRMLEKIGVSVTERVIGRSISRWVPILGAVGVGAYAYYDTTQVAATTIDLFSKPIDLTLPAAKPNG